MPTERHEAVLARLAARQSGVFSREQALRAGFTRHQVQHRVRHGMWCTALPAVYRLATTPRSTEQSLWGAVLWAGSCAVVSHRSAGSLWGLEGVRASTPNLWVPTSSTKRARSVVTRRTDGLAPLDRRFVRGLAVTSPERTLLDLAAQLAEEQLEVAFESARRARLVTIASVERCLERSGVRGRAGVAPLRALVHELGNEPSESGLEVKVARLLRASRLLRPVQQHDVVVFGERYRLDFAWPDHRVALECDGRLRHFEDADFQHDRTKLTALAADGWRTLIVTYADVTQRQAALLARLQRALATAAWPVVRPRGR